MSSLKGKNVLITGGGDGIGLLTAEKLLEEGVNNIIIWDLNPENLASASKKLQNSSVAIIAQQMDVSNTEQVIKMGRRLLADIGAVDILINNAGIIIGGPFSEITSEQIRRTIAVNLTAMMQVARTFLPAMKRQNSGHIVNIASAAGLTPNPNMSVYAASKWGVVGWSESLRIELEQQNTGIHITTAEPSYIDTGMFAGVTPPMLTPLLKPEKFVQRMLRAVKKNHIHLRTPFMVKLLPLLRGILPARLFDLVAGRWFGVYRSMDTFTGRNNTHYE